METGFAYGQEESWREESRSVHGNGKAPSLTAILAESPEAWSDTTRQEVFAVLDAININYTFDACGYRFRDEKGRFVSREAVYTQIENYTSRKSQQDRLHLALHGFRDEMRTKMDAERARAATSGLVKTLQGSKSPAYRTASRTPDSHGAYALTAHRYSLPPILLEQEMILSECGTDGQRVYFLKDRIPPVGFTPLERAFFQEGDDMSYVNDRLHEETTIPVPAQVRVYAKPVRRRLEFPFGRRLVQATAAAVVAGVGLFASYLSRSEAEQPALLAGTVAYESRAQSLFTTPEK